MGRPQHWVCNCELQAEGGWYLPTENDGEVIWSLYLFEILPDRPLPKVKDLESRLDVL
jgi:hypothetical protein